jgi:hypothetical protein
VPVKTGNSFEYFISTLNGHDAEPLPEFGVDDIEGLEDDDMVYLGDGALASKLFIDQLMRHPKVLKAMKT